MSQAASVDRAGGLGRPLVAEGLFFLFGAAVLAALAAALSLALYRYPPPDSVVFAFGIGLVGALALALTRYQTAVGLGFLLLAVVRVEPAPADLVFAVVITVALITGRFDLRRAPWSVAALIGAFLALNLLSTVEVVNGARAIAFSSITFYLAVFSLWLTSYVRSIRAARVILRGYLVGAVVSALLSSLALFAPIPGQDLFTEIGRARGLFKDPNVFGPFLVPAALIMIEEILTPRLLRVGRLMKLLAVLTLGCGILFSYSRAAWLNIGVGVAVLVIVLAVRRGGGRRAAHAFAVLLVAVAAATAVVGFTGSVEFLQERARVQTYDADRFGGQLASIESAGRYPFGIGPGQIEEVADISTHSTYARVLGEQGLPGLIVILALMFVTLSSATGNAIVGRDTYGIGSAALLAAWCGILANSVFIDTLHWRHLWAVAALIWAGSLRAAPLSTSR
jgi:O-antigen ligase